MKKMKYKMADKGPKKHADEKQDEALIRKMVKKDDLKKKK